MSSTYVREAVKEGNMGLVTALLGTPYYVGGEIVHGKQLGRTLGMPTVNLLPPKEKLCRQRVCIILMCICTAGAAARPYDGVQLPSITNIGTKPTVNNIDQMGVETYLYDFNADVYGENIEVYLLEHKRPEMRFGSVEELKAQMREDIAARQELSWTVISDITKNFWKSFCGKICVMFYVDSIGR